MQMIQAQLAPIILFPLIGAICAYLIGLKKKEAAGWIATAASTLSFLWVLKCFFELGHLSKLEHNLFSWMAVADLNIDFLLRFDQLSAVMCLVVTGVGSLIHLYSIGYMAHDDSKPRFFAYLNLFMFSMLVLVLGGNLPMLFIGWEGVGFCSYALIGFWYKNIDFAAAGKKAFIVNRIGDAGFLIAMFLIYLHMGTLDFVELSKSLDGHNVQLYTLITLLLFVGATGKSAQIPLFVWLPDAMAGPTPVSALIHAATMVTAGIYLLARLNYLFVLAPLSMYIISLIALFTAFMAATIALAQNDIKKVLAYSTVSQLGFMFMAAGVGAYWVAIFHLVTHAFFKACLFLCAGSVIHGCHDEQDMRKMGGLAKLMPWTFVTYAVSTIAIAGIFPFAGYFSKHAIIASLEYQFHPLKNSAMAPETALNLFVILASFTAFLTAFYMTRSLVMTFFGKYRGKKKPHESSWLMLAPLLVLASLATVGGYILTELYPLQKYLASAMAVGRTLKSESVLLSIEHSWIGILGIVLGLLFYTKLKFVPERIASLMPGLAKFLERKYYVDEGYDFVIVRPLKAIAAFMFKFFDQSVIDGAVNTTAAVIDMDGEILRASQTGQLRHYAMCIFVAAVAITLFFLVL